MKVGILTYHRAYNYGACLQAYALRIALESLGHTVYFVDYWPQYHKEVYKLFSLNSIFNASSIVSGLRVLLESLWYYPYRLSRKRNFDSFFKKNILPFCLPTTEPYDIIIYGSDQIWRKQPVLNDYNRVYFAENGINSKTHIAYSASMGILPTSTEDKERIKRLLSNFDAISVRENDLKDLLLSFGYNTTIQTLDPTLLLSSKLWDAYLPTSVYNGERYTLVYALNEVFDIEAIKSFSRERGLATKILLGTANRNDTDEIISTAGPMEFLKLIKNADYVFSSSFHGLAFSLIYNKEVFVSFKTNSSRVKSLLESLGIIDRFLEPSSTIPSDVQSINYNSVNMKLQQLREFSFNYLRSL